MSPRAALIRFHFLTIYEDKEMHAAFGISFSNCVSLPLPLPLQQADPLIRGEGPIKKRFASSAPRQTPLLPSFSLGTIGNGRVGLSEGGGDGDDDAPAPTLRGKSDINFKALCEHVGPLLKHV